MEETIQNKDIIYKKPSISKSDFISKLQLTVDEKATDRKSELIKPNMLPKYSQIPQHESPLIKHTIVDDHIPSIDLQSSELHK